MFSKSKLIAGACALGLGLSAAAQAAGADLALVERPADRFHRSIESHLVEVRYATTLERARDLDAAPRRATVAADAGLRELRDAIARVRTLIERAQAEPEFELAGGVSQATLDAIASCESGGDPTAANPAGYYGKYQFDTGTWASVGGSGNPAEASEAEQDYRASLLYARAGSSPWPVCG